MTRVFKTHTFARWMKALKTVASDLLHYSDEELNIAVKNCRLEEVYHVKN